MIYEVSYENITETENIFLIHLNINKLYEQYQYQYNSLYYERNTWLSNSRSNSIKHDMSRCYQTRNVQQKWWHKQYFIITYFSLK